MTVSPVVSIGQQIRNYIVSAQMPDPDVADTNVTIVEYLMRWNLLGYDELTNMPSGSQYTRAGNALQPLGGGWVTGLDSDGAPFRNVETYGTCAVIYFIADEWTQPSLYRSSQYPRLHLQVWADRSRDADGNPNGVHDAEDKARFVWRLLHPLFHDPANVVHAFDALRVHSTVQGGSWSIMDVPGSDGVLRSDCVYNLHLD